MVGDGWMVTSFHQARKIAVTLLYKLKTVDLSCFAPGKILHPLTESNLIPFPEYREIIAQLKHLAAKGEPLPVVVPKLITMDEAAEMLGVSVANFKKQEPYLPFKRKYVDHGVRYRNTDVIRFILSDDLKYLFCIKSQ